MITSIAGMREISRCSGALSLFGLGLSRLSGCPSLPTVHHRPKKVWLVSSDLRTVHNLDMEDDSKSPPVLKLVS